MNLTTAYGKALKAALPGSTQRERALAIGINSGTMCAVEAGKEHVTLERAHRYATSMGLTLHVTVTAPGAAPQRITPTREVRDVTLDQLDGIARAINATTDLTLQARS